MHDRHVPQAWHLRLKIIASVLVELQEQRRCLARLQCLIEGKPQREPGEHLLA